MGILIHFVSLSGVGQQPVTSRVPLNKSSISNHKHWKLRHKHTATGDAHKKHVIKNSSHSMLPSKNQHRVSIAAVGSSSLMTAMAFAASKCSSILPENKGHWLKAWNLYPLTSTQCQIGTINQSSIHSISLVDHNIKLIIFLKMETKT